MTVCPACGSTRVFRSGTRNAVERFRRQFTRKRPYRCHHCRWRGWAVRCVKAVSPENAVGDDAPPPDLGAIDVALEARAKQHDG